MLFRTAPLFFPLYNQDLLDLVILAFARLTDPPETSRRKNANLEQLIDYLGGFYPQLVQQLEEHLQNIRKKCEEIRKWRNEMIAHKGYEAVIRPVPGHGVLGFKRNDVDDALSELWAFLNAFEKQFCDTELQIDPSLPPEEQAKRAEEYARYKISPPAPGVPPRDTEQFMRLLTENSRRWRLA